VPVFSNGACKPGGLCQALSPSGMALRLAAFMSLKWLFRIDQNKNPRPPIPRTIAAPTSMNKFSMVEKPPHFKEPIFLDYDQLRSITTKTINKFVIDQAISTP
jgi:hypothetical protein